MKHIKQIVALLLLAATLLTGCVQTAPPSDDTHESTGAGNTEATPPSGETGTDTGSETDSEPGTETQPPALYSPDPADSTIPVISVTTADEQPITSKTKYKNATLTVSGAAYAHHNVTLTAQIRGRGHSSFDGKAEQHEYASKNSYRLKLDEKSNLLGVGETADRDWVLISGKYDVSALRNFLVWDLADRLGTIPYVPSCTWVNLYVNGQYRGMYTLCEKIEVASDRVNIDESASEDPDQVGYLVEYDLRGAYDTGAKKDLTYFYIPGLDESFAWAIQSEVYSRYNALQKSQGYDLSQYAGKTVMRYVYKINNFPNATEPVYATLLVYKDQIIGGDVTDTSAKGIVQGIKKSDTQQMLPTEPTAPTEITVTE